MRYLILAVPLLLASCASIEPQEFKGPSGRKAYSMRCSGMGRTLDDCYKAAGELCPNGYTIVDRASGTVAVPFRGGFIAAPQYSLAIECKDVKDVVAETSSKPYTISHPEPILPSFVLQPISNVAVIPSGAPSVLPHVEPAVEQAIFNLRRLYPRLKVVDRANMARIENEQAMQNVGAVPPALAVKFGRMAGAQQVLTYQIHTNSDEELVSISKLGGTISTSIAVKLIQVETGEVLFQTTTFDNRHVDPPRKHGVEYWPETKRWRLQSVQAAGTQALADLEVALIWGIIGWHVSDLPAGRTGVWVRMVYPGSRASLAGMQANDIIYKIETPELPDGVNPSVGFWVTPNKEELLKVLSLPANIFHLTVARSGKEQVIKLWFDADEARARACTNWRRDPGRWGIEPRIVQAIACNFSLQTDEAQRKSALDLLNFIVQRLKSSTYAPYQDELAQALEDVIVQSPKEIIGLSAEQQFKKVLDRMKARLAAEGRQVELPIH